MADHNKPTLTDLYTNWPNLLKARSDDCVKWLEGVTATNLPTGAKRWSSSGNLERWSGSAWSLLDSITLSGNGFKAAASSGVGYGRLTTVYTSGGAAIKASNGVDLGAFTDFDAPDISMNDLSYRLFLIL